MTYRYLTDLADACRKSGLRVVELPGWKTRGRPRDKGDFDPSGTLCHHTGDKADGKAYAEWLATKGRPDLAPPLCQVSLDREGTVYVCAAGRANHAGKAKASGPMPAGDGNTIYLGIEAQNTGTEGWGHKGTDAGGNPVTQGEAYVRLVAALHTHYGWAASHSRGHKETSVTGKWDPGAYDMDKHRARVADLMNREDDMTPEEMLHARVKLAGDRYATVVWGQTWAKVYAIEKALQALAAGINPTVEAAVKAALADAVVSVDVNVNGAEK